MTTGLFERHSTSRSNSAPRALEDLGELLSHEEGLKFQGQNWTFLKEEEKEKARSQTRAETSLSEPLRIQRVPEVTSSDEKENTHRQGEDRAAKL